MFKSLKKKLASLFGKPEEKEEKIAKAKKETLKQQKKQKTEKIEKIQSIKEKQKEAKKAHLGITLKKQAEKISEEVPKKFEVGHMQYLPDIQQIKESKETTEQILEVKETQETKIKLKEKQGFLKKLFSKKEIKHEEEVKEKIKEQPLLEEKEEKPSNFFSRILSGKSKISKEDFDKIFDELEIILLENNTALEVVDKIKEDLSKDMVGKEIKKTEIETTITNSLKESISSVLIEPPNILNQIKEKNPYVIVFFGINGSGKTTSIAKIAHLLKKENISSVLAASDTFRAAAIQQLETHANNLKIPIIKQDYGADPTAVAFDAKSYAKKHGIKCVLIDTAGRMYTKENLVKQMEKIIRVIQPDLKIFVGESITGNDVVEQAKTFNEAIGIDGSILTKSDIDEKGGAILSISYVTQKPIYFLGTGQAYDDLETFDKNKVLERLGLN